VVRSNLDYAPQAPLQPVYASCALLQDLTPCARDGEKNPPALTFDMSGGPKGAKRPLARPLDGVVMRSRQLEKELFHLFATPLRESSVVADDDKPALPKDAQ